MDGSVLDGMKTDALGEVYNITMSSAATAVSGMIGVTVSMTSPQITVCKAGEMVSTRFNGLVDGILFNDNEETVYVKLEYKNGLSGSSVMIFNKNDLQMIVNKLMGLPMEISEDFEFDEMSISAINEVMSQMMGASATSLSQMVNSSVEITPPDTKVSNDTGMLYELEGISEADDICAVAVNMSFSDDGNVHSSKFIVVVSIPLANTMANRLMGIEDDEPCEESSENGYSLSDTKRDAIGEIQNIMMGSAATALSNFMNAKVVITTPKVHINKAGKVKFDDLDPSICVRIKYVKGIHGTSVLVLKQSDVQLMVNQLMGLPLVVTDDFEFDELNISAVCEIMNQMMGASATTLSEIISTPTDISTPEAIVIDSTDDILKINNISDDDDVCAISFDLSIDGIMSSHFVTMLSIDLAEEMANRMLNSYSSDLDTYEEPPKAASPKKEEKTSGRKAKQKREDTPKPAAPKPKPKPAPSPAPSRVVNNAASKSLKVEEFHIGSLEDDAEKLTDKQYKNLKTLLDVPMEVAVRIGQTQKSIDEVGNFNKGTIIELDSMANEPVDILVNGNLIARGDVVVVDDNFAVRITEILKQ